jgi:hypothetical protein
MKDGLRETLHMALNPKSIAVIGAPENENKIGGTRGLVSALAPVCGKRLVVRRAINSHIQNIQRVRYD